MRARVTLALVALSSHAAATSFMLGHHLVSDWPATPRTLRTC